MKKDNQKVGNLQERMNGYLHETKEYKNAPPGLKKTLNAGLYSKNILTEMSKLAAKAIDAKAVEELLRRGASIINFYFAANKTEREKLSEISPLLKTTFSLYEKTTKGLGQL